MTKILTKIVLGTDIGQLIAQKIIKKVIKDNFGIDVQLYINKCDINGTDHDTTNLDLHINLEVNNSDLEAIVDRYI